MKWIIGPHGEIEGEVVERAEERGNWIVKLRGLGRGGRRGNAVALTGEEMDAVVKWWEEECK